MAPLPSCILSIVLVVMIDVGSALSAQDERLYLLPASIGSARDVLIHASDQGDLALSQTAEILSDDTATVETSGYRLFDLTTGDSSMVVIENTQHYPYRFTSFTVQRDTLIILDLTGELEFTRRDSTWRLIRQRRFDHTFVSSRIVGDTILLWNQMRASFNPRSSVFYSTRFDRTEDRVMDIIDYPQDSTYVFTFVQPRHVVSCNSAVQAVSAIMRYSIDLYDGRRHLHTLELHDSTWPAFSGAVPQLDGSTRPQSIFPALTDIVRASATIDAVHVLSNNDVLVYRSAPVRSSAEKPPRRYVLDRWRQENGSWQCDSAGLACFPHDSTAPFSMSGDWITPRHRLDGDELIDFCTYPGATLTTTSWPTYRHYVDALNAFAITNEPRVCVRIRSAVRGR